MKKQYLKLLFVEIFLIVFSLLQFFILKRFSVYLYVIEVVGIYAVLRLYFKLDKKNDNGIAKKDALLIIIITCLAYYAITYISGFFVGFVRTTYSTKILGILRNVASAGIFIYFLEKLRKIIISKSKYYKSLIVIALFAITMVEILFSISLIIFTGKYVLLQVVLSVIIPCIFRNIFLTYSMYYFGEKDTLIYHYLMVMPVYMVPIFPNIGDYLQTILLMLHPLITMYLCSNIAFYKREQIKDTDKYLKLIKIEKIVTIVAGIILAVIVYLISDLGRFTVMAIGSESMTGAINKGDVIFIDKGSKDYKVKDIIVYNYENTLVVHRIVDIVDFNAFIAYRTKGDANEIADTWVSYKENIKGKYMFRIRFIGWPTVKLSEYISDLKK